MNSANEYLANADAATGYIYFYKDVCSCSTDLCGGVPDGGEGQGTGRRPSKPEKRPKNGSFYGFL